MECTNFRCQASNGCVIARACCPIGATSCSTEANSIVAGARFPVVSAVGFNRDSVLLFAAAVLSYVLMAALPTATRKFPLD